MKRTKKGFTLIELIVVMAIIAILVLIAAPKFMGYTEKAKVLQITHDIKSTEKAAEQYYLRHDEWPRDQSAIAYSVPQLNLWVDEFRNMSGESITLDTGANYYDVDWNKLTEFMEIPANNFKYIIQNPIGDILYAYEVNESAKYAGKFVSPEEIKVIPPVAVITMTPERGLIPTTNIVWSHLASTDSNNFAIIDKEWVNASNTYAAGEHTVKLRVKNENGVWSDWTEKTFTVDSVITAPILPASITPSSGSYARGSTVNYTWTATTNWGNPVRNQNYRLEYRFNGTGEFKFLANTAMVNNYSFTLPVSTLNETLEVRVRSENAQTESAWRNSTITLTGATTTFVSTGNTFSTYVVPTDGLYQLTATGARGGSGGNLLSNNYGGGVLNAGTAGNFGVSNKGVFNFKKDDILYIYQGTVGGNGSYGYSAGGGGGPQYGYGGGGGGGAASVILLNGTTSENIILSSLGGRGGDGGHQSTATLAAGKGAPGAGGLVNGLGNGVSGSTYFGGNGGGTAINLGEYVRSSTSTDTNGKVKIEVFVP